ncbi:MAG TPA: ribonuclease HI family protein [Gammaproteobacteria bacterium]|nr:ribonuclease HI family protein [Gammaproteobacteria bacterium]
MKMLKIYCDGGSRGNPGPAAAGVVICDSDDNVIASMNSFLGEKTNNFAEYSAVLLALDQLSNYPADHYEFYLDSELVVKQLNGQYKVKNADLRPLYEQIMAWKSTKKTSFTHIRREYNARADEQVNIALDKHENNLEK